MWCVQCNAIQYIIVWDMVSQSLDQCILLSARSYNSLLPAPYRQNPTMSNSLLPELCQRRTNPKPVPSTGLCTSPIAIIHLVFWCILPSVIWIKLLCYIWNAVYQVNCIIKWIFHLGRVKGLLLYWPRNGYIIVFKCKFFSLAVCT